MKLEILHEDNHLIAVYKPPGILVQADKKNQPCLMDFVKEYLKEKYNKKGNVFLGLLHRLDRNVCGIVLFAKTSKGASRLSKQFRNHTVEKFYQAVVLGKIKKQKGVLINYLKKDKQKNKVSVYNEKIEGALSAELEYEVLEYKNNYSLIKIKLKTGRPHQIRAQFAHLGNPIAGDVKYGAQEVLPNDEIALCAVNLKFSKATEEKIINLQIDSPKIFKKLLQ